MKNNEVLKALVELSRFRQILNPVNLSIGLNVWVRSSGIQLIISMTLYFLGILEQLGDFGLMLLLFLNFALLQWAVSSEARHRFALPAPPMAWFSVFWRVLLITLPLAVILVSVMIGPVDIQNEAALEEARGQMLTVQVILLLVSIIPTGIATSQTLRNFVLQLDSFMGGGKEEQPPGDKSNSDD